MNNKTARGPDSHPAYPTERSKPDRAGIAAAESLPTTFSNPVSHRKRPQRAGLPKRYPKALRDTAIVDICIRNQLISNIQKQEGTDISTSWDRPPDNIRCGITPIYKWIGFRPAFFGRAGIRCRSTG